MPLTAEQRAALPETDFAAPGRRLPIYDVRHVQMAWSQVMRAALTDVERTEARRRIAERAHELGVNLEGTLSAMAFEGPLAGMALDLPAVADHPNRLPFSGVLTQLDTPSDRPPNGSKGRKVILTAAAAERALPSLLGMAVNYMDAANGHDVKRKIGVITAASIQNNAVHIDDGIIYAADFPKEAARIQSDKDRLGFSWELANIFVENVDADPLVITDCVFTGAAILRKDKAAYSSTSLSAAAGEIDQMTKEELAAVLAEATAPLTAQITELKAAQTKMDETLQASAAVMSKVEPHAAALDSQADKMEAEGVGTDARSGHVKVLRNMASSMRASAAMGRVPASYSDGMYASAEQPAATDATTSPEVKALKDELAALGTKFADLQAAASKEGKAPERKTLSPHITALLAKADITVPEDGKLEAGKLDVALAASGLSTAQRLATKASLAQAGVLAR